MPATLSATDMIYIVEHEDWEWSDGRFVKVPKPLAEFAQLGSHWGEEWAQEAEGDIVFTAVRDTVPYLWMHSTEKHDGERRVYVGLEWVAMAASGHGRSRWIGTAVRYVTRSQHGSYISDGLWCVNDEWPVAEGEWRVFDRKAASIDFITQGADAHKAACERDFGGVPS